MCTYIVDSLASQHRFLELGVVLHNCMKLFRWDEDILY
jgi:hypothetical protein